MLLYVTIYTYTDMYTYIHTYVRIYIHTYHIEPRPGKVIHKTLGSRCRKLVDTIISKSQTLNPFHTTRINTTSRNPKPFTYAKALNPKEKTRRHICRNLNTKP